MIHILYTELDGADHKCIRKWQIEEVAGYQSNWENFTIDYEVDLEGYRHGKRIRKNLSRLKSSMNKDTWYAYPKVPTNVSLPLYSLSGNQDSGEFINSQTNWNNIWHLKVASKKNQTQVSLNCGHLEPDSYIFTNSWGFDILD